jgi:beta-phosphoglucomutase-like phosphatase (HAD superfamily)
VILPPVVIPGRFRACVFGVDGLLIDSEPVWAGAQTLMYSRRGVEYTDHDRRAVIGVSTDVALTHFTLRLGAPPSARAAIHSELLGLVRSEYLAGPRARPGAVELVTRLWGRVPLLLRRTTPES